MSQHPPLGTWLVALGVRIFGFRPGGWRAASLVAGTLTVILLYWLGRRLFHSTLAATIASALLALDFLHFVHSRLAMLDIFVTLFGVAAFLFAVLDRSHRGRIGQRGLRGRISARRWRLAAGVAGGAVVASKWAGLPSLAAVALLTFLWEFSSRPASAVGQRLLRTARQEGPSILVAFVALPAVIYVASFAGRLDGSLLVWPFSEGAWFRSFLDRQLEMLNFHLGVSADNPYVSPAWSWPLIRRPIPYFVQAPADRYQLVLALGNPLVWWGSLVALVWLAQDWVRRRGEAQGVILAGFLAAWLPWVLLGATRRLTFLFYLLPAVPFMCLAVADVLRRSVGSTIGKAASAMMGAALVASFLFYYPVLTAQDLTLQAWDARVLFEQCGRLPTLADGDRRVREILAHAEETPGPYPEALARTMPPPGWCWV